MAIAIEAVVVREYVPFADRKRIHGVTFDGARLWFSRDDELVALDPVSGEVTRRFPVPGASAGTAFDGQRLYQVAKGEIIVVDPSNGTIVRRFAAPDPTLSSGMAWGAGRLYVAQILGAIRGGGRPHESCIHTVDPQTGAVIGAAVKRSDRLATGVTWVDGALWHGAAFDGAPSELRRIAPDGSVAEVLRVPVEEISGVEATRDGGFWCAGERGTLREVRRG